MACELAIDFAVKSDFLDCDSDSRREIGDFLLDLQGFPWPPGRHQRMSPHALYAYYFQLPCGHFIAWEILGSEENLMKLTLLRDTCGITVRILGVGREPRSARPR